MLNLEYAKDMAGNEVKVGDSIVSAFTQGRSSELRMGVVQEIKAGKADYSGRQEIYLVVLWSLSSGRVDVTKPTRIRVNLGRFLKLS